MARKLIIGPIVRIVRSVTQRVIADKLRRKMLSTFWILDGQRILDDLQSAALISTFPAFSCTYLYPMSKPSNMAELRYEIQCQKKR
uniref:Cytochrome P450 n=1 Tax=Steinernema glaseri TaxID=37863 RepID=A0A1I7YWZ5_9BILA